MIVLASKAELEAAWERVKNPTQKQFDPLVYVQFAAAFIEGYKCARGLPPSAVIDFK